MVSKVNPRNTVAVALAPRRWPSHTRTHSNQVGTTSVTSQTPLTLTMAARSSLAALRGGLRAARPAQIALARGLRTSVALAQGTLLRTLGVTFRLCYCLLSIG